MFEPLKDFNGQESFIISVSDEFLSDSQIIVVTVSEVNDPPIANDIVVEVPGIVNKNGVKGLKLENYPSSFGSLLNNQASTIQLTTDAIINKSKHSVYLALLADPIVDNAKSAERLIETMISFQKDYLGYLN